MPHGIIFLIGLLAPVVVMVVLRINAAFVFLSLCLGEVLVKFLAGDVNTFIGAFSPHTNPVSNSVAQLAVLLLPVVLTAVMMVWSVRGRVRSLLNMAAALGTSLVGALLVVPLLAPGLRTRTESQAVWHQLVRAQSLIVGLSAVIGLLLLWSNRRRERSEERRRR